MFFNYFKWEQIEFWWQSGGNKVPELFLNTILSHEFGAFYTLEWFTGQFKVV